VLGLVAHVQGGVRFGSRAIGFTELDLHRRAPAPEVALGGSPPVDAHGARCKKLRRAPPSEPGRMAHDQSIEPLAGFAFLDLKTEQRRQKTPRSPAPKTGCWRPP
jgi:hypothetical protein